MSKKYFIKLPVTNSQLNELRRRGFVRRNPILSLTIFDTKNEIYPLSRSGERDIKKLISDYLDDSTRFGTTDDN